MLPIEGSSTNSYDGEETGAGNVCGEKSNIEEKNMETKTGSVNNFDCLEITRKSCMRSVEQWKPSRKASLDYDTK